MDTSIRKRPTPVPYPDASDVVIGSTEPDVPPLAHGHREDFFLLANCRAMLGPSYHHKANWVVAMELFATGSTSAHQICRDAGIDPDAKTVQRDPGARL